MIVGVMTSFRSLISGKADIGVILLLLPVTVFLGKMGATVQNDAPHILLLADDSWGANWNIEDEKSSLSEMFLSYGWKLDLASVKGEIASCEFARQATGVKSLRMDLLVSDISSLKDYAAVVVLPGQSHENLMASSQALELLREADREGLVVAGFCRGVRVLAAAGVVRDHRITGHPDYAAEYKSAGAVYLGFKDLETKADAPPPVVDGNIVTIVRSKYYRKEAGEAIRAAVENARSKK
jgi:putative intracellular protease/amidase